jgi:uncharacterized protein (DUF2235 family)
VKRLVICCDGTWSDPFKGSPTNVVRFYDQVATRDAAGVEQKSHYLKGVGCGPLERLRGGIFGYGLSTAVRTAYAWVVEHFEPGDEIYALGFSRGAFTARSTVGLIRKAGVLRRDEADRVKEAYELYRRTDLRPDDQEAVRWRAAYSRETRVRFVGVWDTVGALGVPLTGIGVVDRFNKRFSFHDTQLSSSVDAAYHAVAVDERREPFRPTLWEPHGSVGDQVVEQVWFAGSHSDVGGGHKDRDLADLTLWWMQQKARSHGLAIDGPEQREPGWAMGTVHDSRTLVFKLAKALDRPIGVTDPHHERAASTAADRIELDSTYRPPQLRAYLDDGGQVAQL